MWRFSLAAIVLCMQLTLHAQTDKSDRSFAEFDYTEPKTYDIAKVGIKGTESRDVNAIKTITGLREGNTVTIPSPELSTGIKKLWNLGIFSDITLVMDSIQGDSVYLSIELLEQPILSKIIFKDANKTKQDKLKEELGETLRIGGIPTINNRQVAKRKIESYYKNKGFLDDLSF